MNPDPRSNHSTESGGRVHPLDWARSVAMTEAVEQEMHACVRRRRHRFLRVMAGGAAAMLVLFAAVLASRRTAEPGGSAIAESRFHITSPERQALPDGSVVELKGTSQISVDFTAAARRVRLLEGEAHFEVRKDPARPFIVSAGGIDVRAVGTAFVVQLASRDVEVLVTEGEVAVEPVHRAGAKQEEEASMAAPRWTDLRVEAGRRVRVEPDTPREVAPAVQPVSPPEMAERLAWRVPLLEFHATPLAEVVPLFNQYANVRVAVAEPELDKLRLSGVLRADNVAVLVQILESSYDVVADRQSPGAVMLSRRR